MKKNTTFLKLFLFVGTAFILYAPNAYAAHSFLKKREIKIKAVETTLVGIPDFAINYFKNDYHLVGKKYQPSKKFKNKTTYIDLINKHENDNNKWGFYASSSDDKTQLNFRFVCGIQKECLQMGMVHAIYLIEGTILTEDKKEFLESMRDFKKGLEFGFKQILTHSCAAKVNLEKIFSGKTGIENIQVKQINIPKPSKK